MNIQALLKERGRGRPQVAGTLQWHLRKHMVGGIYTAMEESDFNWTEQQLYEFVDLWQMGVPIQYIAQNFGRVQEETGILVVDLAMHGVIQPRQGGVWGKGA